MWMKSLSHFMLPRLWIGNHVAHASQCAQLVKSDHPLRQHFRCSGRCLSVDLRTTSLHCRQGHHCMSTPRPEPRRRRRKQLHAPIGGDFDISLQDVHGGFSFINRRLASGHYFEVHPRAARPAGPWSPLRPGVITRRLAERACWGCRLRSSLMWGRSWASAHLRSVGRHGRMVGRLSSGARARAAVPAPGQGTICVGRAA